MRRLLYPAVGIGVLAICRLALGGEGNVAATGDPVGLFWKILSESGIWGLFLGYMVYRDDRRDKRDQERNEREEKRREAASERFHALDKQLVGMIEKSTAATSGVEGALRQMQDLFKEHNGELRHLNRTLVRGEAKGVGRE